MKQFFKPTWAKIILTIVLFCYAFFFGLSLRFPLESLYYPPVNCPEGAVCMPPMPEINLSIFIFNLAFNLILSYLISYFVVLIYDKLRNMKIIKSSLSVIIIFGIMGFVLGFLGSYSLHNQQCDSSGCVAGIYASCLAICIVIISFIPVASIFLNKSVSILGVLISFIISLVSGATAFLLLLLICFSDASRGMGDNPLYGHSIIFAIFASIVIAALTKLAMFLPRKILPKK